MEVSDIQFVDGKIEVTFMNGNGADVMVILLSISDAEAIGTFAKNPPR